MKIAIIGVGLIGGSIGLALRGKNLNGKKIRITGIGRNPLRLALARRMGALDDFTTEIKEGVKDADVIFIATPVKTIPSIFAQILPHCQSSAIITDVGSSKKEILAKISKILSRHKKSSPRKKTPFFVGSHPIAGGEKTSVVYARSDLFKNATTVITPLPRTPLKVINTVKKLWLSTSSKVHLLTPDAHDSTLARTSHLPHIAAYALVKSIIPSRDKNFTGSGWRDTTRIASSNPSMWAEILNSNQSAVREAIKKFKSNLSLIEKSLSDEKSLTDIFSEAKATRDSILKNL